MPLDGIRVFCKRCQKWCEEQIDISRLAPGKQGLYSVALNHGNHILTVYFDKDLKVRGESIADALQTLNESEKEEEKAIDFFDKI